MLSYTPRPHMMALTMDENLSSRITMSEAFCATCTHVHVRSPRCRPRPDSVEKNTHGNALVPDILAGAGDSLLNSTAQPLLPQDTREHTQGHASGNGNLCDREATFRQDEQSKQLTRFTA